MTTARCPDSAIEQQKCAGKPCNQASSTNQSDFWALAIYFCSLRQLLCTDKLFLCTGNLCLFIGNLFLCTAETFCAMAKNFNFGLKKYRALIRVWKGVLGIRDLTKIQCGNRENENYLDGIRDLTAHGMRDFFSCLLGIREIVAIQMVSPFKTKL